VRADRIYFLAICDRLLDILFASTLQNAAQQCVAFKNLRSQWNISIGQVVRVTRGKNQTLASFSRVNTRGPDILESALPEVADVPRHRSFIAGGRDLEHHRPDVFRVEERHQVNDAGIRGQGLILPIEKTRPVTNLIEIAAYISKSLKH